MEKDNIVKISVRNLVEFILRTGDIDNTKVGMSDSDAMQEGSRIHRKIQKKMGPEYHAEVPLSITIPVEYHKNELQLCVDGRADGIIHRSDEEVEPTVIIDEIKGVYMDLSYLKEPISVHRAQVMCYAYIYAIQNQIEKIGIQLTYCNIETEQIKRFEETLHIIQLEQWFMDLVHGYAKWAGWQLEWNLYRNASIKKVEFPFPYRPGQRDLVAGVYKTIIRNKKLYIEAPTGVGKTISTVFPSVKAMGEGYVSKIFYLTAKTITRTVAEDTFGILANQGIHMKIVTITAKDKICIMEKAVCNPIDCERAKGHYDRVNDAVYDLLTSEDEITRNLIMEYAQKHMVCPFEMCLDTATWADSIICDYNYAFDPNVYLKRFFANEKKNDYIFLIDEAHNLVERAREMYSAVLYKKDFLEVKKLIKEKDRKLTKKLELCNADLLKLKRLCDECEVVEHITDFVLHLMQAAAEYEEFLREYPSFDGREITLQLYFDIRHFLSIYEFLDDNYITYTDYDEMAEFRMKLQCMNPAGNLAECLKKGKSAIFFSATLLPIKYYKEQLAGTDEDYAIYAPSPFDPKNRLLMIAKDVSTKYTRRSDQEFKKIAQYIEGFISAKTGNYLVFFASYQMMKQVADYLNEDAFELRMQQSNMSEAEKEEFLDSFIEDTTITRVGFCVMGGVFSEGIDLKNDRLIGAVIVGTGLPMVCNERELFRGYYDKKSNMGFEYAYLYNGMNKVLQSAGRVIRTIEDRGAILLLDERFMNTQYKNLFPMEWFSNILVNQSNMKTELERFWEGKTND